MRLLILAVGKLKSGPEKALVEEYARRLTWPLGTREVEARGRLEGPALKAREAELLLAALDQGGQVKGGPGKGGRRVVALDERGDEPDSAAFAGRIGAWRDQGVDEIAFVIGGAGGLDESLRTRADWVVAFGRLTWPHLLVRALLAEQLYRAQQILAGHPYHRA